MTVLETFQGIGLEIHVAIEILFVKCFHGNLALATILGPIMFAVEVEIVFHGAAGVGGLFILPRRNRRGHRPKHHQNWNGRENGEEAGGVEPTTHLPGEIVRNNIQENDEQRVGEAIAAS